MRVHTQHVIDAGPPDDRGIARYRYEFDLYRFVERRRILLARAYCDTATDAHLLSLTRGGRSRALVESDLADPLVHAALEWLRAAGKSRVCWLDRVTGEYRPIDG